jgi:hypothetical protein
MAPPSVHPDGGIYKWKSYHNNIELPFVPEMDSLPDLPQAWIDFLSNTKDEKIKEKKAKESDDFKAESVELGGESCVLMNAIIGTRLGKLKNSGIVRHDEMIRATWAIINEGNKGHGGALLALETYERAWLGQFGPAETKGRNLEAEFSAAVNRAIMKMTDKPSECRCGSSASSEYKKPYIKRTPKRVSDFKMWR